MEHKEYRIHPCIARLGSNEEEIFIDPDSPGISHLYEGDYKDDQGAIKRQAPPARYFGSIKKYLCL